MRDPVKKLLQFDKIRFLKLLEICQFSLIGFSLTLIIGNILNNKCLSDYDLKELSDLKLIGLIMLELMILVIVTYYIKKVVLCFPFLFGFLYKNYIPSKNDEATVGYIVGTSIILRITIDKLVDKIKEIDLRFKKRFVIS
jgi:hypothetical protein